MAKTGIASPNGIACHMRALEQKGYLKRDHAKDKHRARAYVVPGLKEAIASAVSGVKAALLDGPPKLAPVMAGLAEIDETA
jgi:SOS-response transcriptional repressor LexA